MHTLSQFQAGIAALTTEEVQLVIGAMIFDSTLLAELKSHCTAMETSSPRIGVFMLKNGEVVKPIIGVNPQEVYQGEIDALLADGGE